MNVGLDVSHTSPAVNDIDTSPAVNEFVFWNADDVLFAMFKPFCSFDYLFWD